MTAHQRGIAWALLFGVLFLVVELLGAMLRAQYTVFEIVWIRYAVHLLIMALVLGRQGVLLPWQTRGGLRQQIRRSLLMLAMPVLWTWTIALGASPLSAAGSLAAAPIFTALVERFRFGRTVGLSTWVCAALSAAGGALTMRHADGSGPLVLSLAAALCLALYVIETERLRDEPIATNLFHTAFWVFAVLTPVQHWVWVTPPLHDWPFLVAIGAVGLLALLALDHMTREASYIAATSLINIQILLPVGLVALNARALPSAGTVAALLLMAGAAILAWQHHAAPVRRYS